MMLVEATANWWTDRRHLITVAGDTIVSKKSNEERTTRFANEPNGLQSFHDKELFYCECNKPNSIRSITFLAASTAAVEAPRREINKTWDTSTVPTSYDSTTMQFIRTTFLTSPQSSSQMLRFLSPLSC